jgi:Ca-activated chloride channel family protein
MTLQLSSAVQGAGALVAEPTRSAAEGQLHLWGDLALADPWFLALAPLALLAPWWGRRRAARAAGNVPGLPVRGAPLGLRQVLAPLPALLQALAMLLAIVALARPLKGADVRETTSEGIDIVLVVDRSSSMEAQDLEPNRTRLDVVTDVVGDFAERRMTDEVGAADNIALLAFARYPQLLCPFTLDADALRAFFDELDIVHRRAEDGTAIGSALAKAARLLADSEAKSRVVVLLTDGRNTVDDIVPMDAAQLAAEYGVRVYTVLAGRVVYTQDVFGRIRATEMELPSDELEEIAELTGGRFFRAKDRESLEQVYAEIEALERTPRTERRYVETWDLYPWPLAASLGAYLLAWLLASTWLRRLS